MTVAVLCTTCHAEPVAFVAGDGQAMGKECIRKVGQLVRMAQHDHDLEHGRKSANGCQWCPR